MMTSRYVLVLISVISAIVADPVVKTKNGWIKGFEAKTVGEQKPYYRFHGIPYAEPPLGNLRFAPPVAKGNWDGILDATQEHPDCSQIGVNNSVVGSEDCLYLNIYTPSNPSEPCSELLPVYLFIHGGGFEGGSARYEHAGPDYIIEKGIVMITTTYRLGIFGFLSTNDQVVPGNNGLKDQVEAMRWVQKNVKNFCGDPNRVTIGGQSAGAGSVGYHVHSPLSKGLFQQAVLQSGSSICLWALSRRVPEVTKQIAENLGINVSSSQSIVDGLRSVSAADLEYMSDEVASANLLATNPREGLMFGPISEPPHEGAFFSGRSHEQLANGDFNKVPILLGFTSLEGAYNFEPIFRVYLAQFDLFPERLLPFDMNVVSYKRLIAALQIKWHYFNIVPGALTDYPMMKFLTDDQFVRGVVEFARLVSVSQRVYLYKFSYEGGLWGLQNRTVQGVTHSEDLGYLFTSPHTPSDKDRVVRERTVKLYTNFIKSGNPTPARDPVLQNVLWKTYDQNQSFLEIGDDLIAGNHPEKSWMDFWYALYRNYGRPPYSTY